jgi:hypothetical protein
MSSMRLRDLSTEERLSNISRRLKEDQSLMKTDYPEIEMMRFYRFHQQRDL